MPERSRVMFEGTLTTSLAERDRLRWSFLAVLATMYPQKFERLDSLGPVFAQARLTDSWYHSRIGFLSREICALLPADWREFALQRFNAATAPPDVQEILDGLWKWARDLRLAGDSWGEAWVFVAGARALHQADYWSALEPERPTSPTHELNGFAFMSGRTRLSLVDERLQLRPPELRMIEPLDDREAYLREAFALVEGYVAAAVENYRAMGLEIPLARREEERHLRWLARRVVEGVKYSKLAHRGREEPNFTTQAVGQAVRRLAAAMGLERSLEP